VFCPRFDYLAKYTALLLFRMPRLKSRQSVF